MSFPIMTVVSVVRLVGQSYTHPAKWEVPTYLDRMSSTKTSPADTAGMTALVIPEDMWILHILNYLDPLALSRLARTCRMLREHTDSYRNNCAYGRRLALAGLRRVHSLLVARHTKCAGQSGLAELTKSVGAYTTRLCVSYHDLPAAAAAPEEEPGRRRKRQIAAAVGGATARPS